MMALMCLLESSLRTWKSAHCCQACINVEQRVLEYCEVVDC